MEKNQAYSGVPVSAVPGTAAPVAGTAIVAQPMGEAGHPNYVDFSKFKPIPTNFIRVDPLCCAVGCNNCNAAECCGAKQLVKCGCLEVEANQCRYIENDEKACCLMSLASVEVVDCENMTFKCYTQKLCFECLCGCPLDETYIDTPPVTLTNYGRIDERDLYPWSTACCFCCGSIDSLYIKFPQFIGIYTNSENCCFYTSNACLKPMCDDENNPKKNLQFLCARNRWLRIRPRVCCKDQSQVFCIDHRCACPFDDDVPCAYMFPLTFYTVCVDYRCVGRCCMTYADMLQFQAEGRGKNTNV